MSTWRERAAAVLGELRTAARNLRTRRKRTSKDRIVVPPIELAGTEHSWAMLRADISLQTDEVVVALALPEAPEGEVTAEMMGSCLTLTLPAAGPVPPRRRSVPLPVPVYGVPRCTLEPDGTVRVTLARRPTRLEPEASQGA